MKILFKSDERIFFIEYDELYWNFIIMIDVNLNDIIHIKESPIIYHLIDNNHKYPVYYEYKDRYIIFDDILNYYKMIYDISDVYQKDYTQVNINKILNGNII